MCVGNKDEKEYPTEDNNFWPKCNGMRYAPGIPMTHFKRVIGWLIYQIGKKLSQKMVITYRKQTAKFHLSVNSGIERYIAVISN